MRRSRPGPPAPGEPTAHDRILATASALFYEEGIRAIGVDTIVERSGVSKTSLYRLFSSKDALIAAVAAEQDRQFWAWWDRLAERHAEDPQGQLVAILKGVAKYVGNARFRGCAFLNLATEFPDESHPGRIIARANKDELRNRIAGLLGRLGTAEPERAAARLALLINGAYATGLVGGAKDLERDLVESAMLLIRRRKAGDADP